MLVTDKLRSHPSAFRRLRLTCPHEQGLRKNYRAENSHQAVRQRERKMQRFQSAHSAQRFLCMHPVVHKPLIFNAIPCRVRRSDIPSRGGEPVARCGSGRVIAFSARGSFCLTDFNLTMPR